MKFYSSFKHFQNPEILHLFCVQKSNVRSTFVNNCFKLIVEFEGDSVDDINYKNISLFKIPGEEELRLPLLFDLPHLKKGSF